jgi:hypothetical protein
MRLSRRNRFLRLIGMGGATVLTCLVGLQPAAARADGVPLYPPEPRPLPVVIEHLGAAILNQQILQNNVTYSFSGTCSAPAGITVGVNQPYTVAVTSQAIASSSSPTVIAVATGVRCSVEDEATGAVLGTIGDGLPGPVALAAGTVTAPAGTLISLCITETAVFSDGFRGSASTC